MVLDKDSSVLGYPGEISKPLDADHHGVCKYPSRSDPKYIAVRNVLKTLIGKTRSEGGLVQLFNATLAVRWTNRPSLLQHHRLQLEGQGRPSPISANICRCLCLPMETTISFTTAGRLVLAAGLRNTKPSPSGLTTRSPNRESYGSMATPPVGNRYFLPSSSIISFRPDGLVSTFSSDSCHQKSGP